MKTEEEIKSRILAVRQDIQNCKEESLRYTYKDLCRVILVNLEWVLESEVE